MKRLIVNGKERILITPKQLQTMLEWYYMASNSGDNDITSKEVCVEKLKNAKMNLTSLFKQTYAACARIVLIS